MRANVWGHERLQHPRSLLEERQDIGARVTASCRLCADINLRAKGAVEQGWSGQGAQCLALAIKQADA